MQHFASQCLDWNDLRLVLAVARTGSFAKAASHLGVSTPTIFRQANGLEERVGTLIFHRDNKGVSLTSSGRDAAALAERIDLEIGGLEARIANVDVEAAGSIRLASVDTLIAGPLMPILARFRQAHPAIRLDLRSGIGMADLRQREADAALRAGGEPPESLIGRRLCRIAVAVYRSEKLADPRAQGLEESPWVVPGDELGHLASANWLKENGHWSRAALRANSLHSIALAVANGLGLGVLPCYLADRDRRLVRVGDPIDELASDLWFLTHVELRHTARMKALSDFLAVQFQALRPLFQGDTAARN
jgi:DNA-binding transcriptional LysR family regulator